LENLKSGARPRGGVEVGWGFHIIPNKKDANQLRSVRSVNSLRGKAVSTISSDLMSPPPLVPSLPPRVLRLYLKNCQDRTNSRKKGETMQEKEVCRQSAPPRPPAGLTSRRSAPGPQSLPCPSGSQLKQPALQKASCLSHPHRLSHRCSSSCERDD
jgi:hypothetical protein